MGNSSWASPKNSKSKSSGGGGGGRGDQSYAKQKREAAARKKAATPKAKQPNQNNNQRANLPSEVARPVTPVVKTTPLASNNIQQNEARPSGTLKSGLTPQVADVIKPIAQSKTSQDPKLLREMGVAKKGSKSSLLSINPTEDAPKIKTTMGKVTDGYGVNAAVTAGSAYKNQPKTPTTKASAPSVATAPEARINLSKDNKTVAATPKYDQEYWAGKRASGVSQADMKAEQDSIGMSKAYSGDKVVTADMKRKASDDLSRVTGSMATIENGGVTKTESEKYGLLNERQDTTYNYKGGPSIVTKANDPSLFGLNFGDKTSTTYVDGTEVATKTGRDPLGKDAKVTRPEGLAKDINDTQDIDPVKAADEITDIDNQIKAETDPVKLKALYQRRLRLIRMSRTNTKFAGLLGEADTKKSILTSIM